MASLSDVLAGRYRLVRLLGRGGMSDVYEAVDEHNGAIVAAKIVRSGDPELASRMAQEARALEGLQHPGLVRLLDAGVADGQAYLVMELVEGSSLSERLHRGSLAPEGVARLGADLADALAYVHSHGIVHRDVKPSNILLMAGGMARLGDFGIARIVDASTLTITGTTLGTAAYMAPEQLEDHQVGPSADIWSLGIVLLESLTGHRVYEGTPSEVVARRLAGPVPIPGDLPVPWKMVLSGMLDHRPDQRLDGAEVAAVLQTSPFRVEWVRDRSRPEQAGVVTAPYDLTSLADAPTATAMLVGGGTRVAPPGSVVASHPEGVRRRWWLAALGVAAAIALGVGLLLAIRPSPAGHHRTGAGTSTSSASTASTSTVPTTTSTTASPTTTVASGPAALARLVGDVASGIDNGSVDHGTGQAITSQAQQAVTDEAAGMPNQAASDLQQVSTDIANGLQTGKISQAKGATLQGDLNSLADALGLSAAATPPSTQPGPSPGPGNGHGTG